MKKLVSIFLVLSICISMTSIAATYATNNPTSPATMETTIAEDYPSNLTPDEQKALEASKKDRLVEIKNNFKIFSMHNFGLNRKVKIILCSVAGTAVVALGTHLIYKII